MILAYYESIVVVEDMIRVRPTSDTVSPLS